MIETAYYLVSEAIAQRSGLINQRYRTSDNRYILDYKDMQRIHFTPQEIINGLSGVESITAEEAKRLIAQGNYAMGAQQSAVSNDGRVEEEAIVNEEPTAEDAPSDESEQPTDKEEQPAEESADTGEDNENVEQNEEEE